LIGKFDVAIVGTGTMGSAAAFFLTQAGFRVVAFEQFGIAHEMGSHSGSTRIIRHAYHESPDYVPLVLRSDQLWQELEAQTGSRLLVRTGGVDLGPREGLVVENALNACRIHSLPNEYLNSEQVMERWKQFKIPEDWHGCFDPNMGFLLVDDCIRAYAGVARAAGAELHIEEPVLHFADRGETIKVTTSRAEYDTAKLIVCAGAWSSRILAELRLPLTVKRKTLAWLEVDQPNDFEPGKFPIFLAETPAGLLYGFPIFGKRGLKIANHHGSGPPDDPDLVNREFSPDDADDAREFALRYLNGVSSKVLEGKICLYTLTPDEHFIIDLHPENKNIAIAAGFSGHGFKFAPAVGEALSQLIAKQSTSHSIEKFSLSRFRNI
jgi:monomeric sarcosine oxidase